MAPINPLQFWFTLIGSVFVYSLKWITPLFLLCYNLPCVLVAVIFLHFFPSLHFFCILSPSSPLHPPVPHPTIFFRVFLYFSVLTEPNWLFFSSYLWSFFLLSVPPKLGILNNFFLYSFSELLIFCMEHVFQLFFFILLCVHVC